jgi:sugar phosphate isomerase/epimerase
MTDGATALLALSDWGAPLAVWSPGRPVGRDRARAEDRWGGKLLLHHACLEEPDGMVWNFAARDEDVRKRSVAQATEAIRHAAALGSPFYSLHAGYALETTLTPSGRAIGPQTDRKRALDQLMRSLDTLAAQADNGHLGLLLENPARPEGLLAIPDEVRQTFERLGAAHVGLLFDTAHWVLSCRARRWDPEEPLEEIKAFVRAIEVSHTDSKTDGHLPLTENSVELSLARQVGGLELPVILEARNLKSGRLEDQAVMLEELLKPQASAQK